MYSRHHYPGYSMRTCLVTLLVLMLSACAAADKSKKSITLDKALYQYETAIRWVDFGLASSLQRLEPGTTANNPDPELLKHIKVTSYNVLETTTSPANDEVQMSVEIVYYHDERMTLTTITDRQTWKYDPEIKAWFITTPLPAFH